MSFSPTANSVTTPQASSPLPSSSDVPIVAPSIISSDMVVDKEAIKAYEEGRFCGLLKNMFSLHFLKYKIIYITLNLYIYGFHTVQNLMFKDDVWDLSNSMVGIMSTVMVGNYYGGKMWGSLADRTGRHKEIIAWTALGYTLMGCVICFPSYFLPFEGGYSSNFLPKDQVIFTYAIKFGRILQIFSGWLAFFVFNFFLSAAFPLADRLIIGMLDVDVLATKNSHGYQRLWGVVGHWIISIISLQIFKDKNKFTCHLYIWIMQFICSIIFVIAMFFIIPDDIKAGKRKPYKPKNKKIIISDISVQQADDTSAEKDGQFDEEDTDTRSPDAILFSNPSFVMFLAFVFCSGVIRCITTNYGKIIIVERVGSDGIAAVKKAESARALSEVFAYLASPFLKKNLGVYWVLIMSQIFGILRIIGYGFIPKVDDKNGYSKIIQDIFIISLELGKGFNSGFISSSAIPIAHDMAPPGCETTAQTLYSGMYSGMSFVAGGLICAFYFQVNYDSSITDKIKRQSYEALKAMNLNIYVGLGSTIFTVILMSKFIFIDRVMGIPGYPARHHM